MEYGCYLKKLLGGHDKQFYEGFIMIFEKGELLEALEGEPKKQNKKIEAQYVNKGLDKEQVAVQLLLCLVVIGVAEEPKENQQNQKKLIGSYYEIKKLITEENLEVLVILA